ncbi:hypothetical protein CRE_07405 [Caenorhabditis remanei]|uniref:Protein kinase domain-containing protein n=1 Tax=Caenorhabditis remanei TaxID=31234 RepID=E3M2Z5_CAERE|nr:hypothetical protein CRE_07405 [Caenorhabditis remanei]
MRENEQLQLLFHKSCDRNIKCVLYKNGRPSTSLTTDSRDIRTLIQTNHDFLSCVRSSNEVFSFRIFVQDGNKFFKKASFVNYNSTVFQLQCIGGFYTNSVKLKANERLVDLSYDPLHGFFLNKKEYPDKQFYQCEFQDERVSFDYSDLTTVNGRFRMDVQLYSTTMSINCIIENPSELENVTVILGCNNQSNCRKLVFREISETKAIFGTFVNVDRSSNPHDYYCVFLKNEEIEAMAFYQKENLPVTECVLGLLGFGMTGVILVWIINRIGQLNNNKNRSPTSKYKHNKSKYSDTDFLLSEKKLLIGGNSSKIYIAKHIPSEKNIVIKYSKNKMQCRKEFEILKNMCHANIVKPYGYTKLITKNGCFKKPAEHLLLPYYQNTCLEQYIKQFYPVSRAGDTFHSNDESKKELTLFDMVSIGWQVARALKYLREQNITHRDVAMRNVLITDHLICKLTDFERAEKGETKKVSVATKLYRFFTIQTGDVPKMYPIECDGGAYYYSSEIYCFGLLLLEMFQFTKPMEPQKKWPPHQPQNCPNVIYEIIADCLKVERKRRISIKECEAKLEMIAKFMNENVTPMLSSFVSSFNLQKLKDIKTELIKEGIPPTGDPLPPVKEADEPKYKFAEDLFQSI